LFVFCFFILSSPPLEFSTKIHHKSGQKLKTVVKQARDVKAQRVRAHSKPGTVPFVAERKKHILKEVA
jgi:hypothetical protein